MFRATDKKALDWCIRTARLGLQVYAQQHRLGLCVVLSDDMSIDSVIYDKPRERKTLCEGMGGGVARFKSAARSERAHVHVCARWLSVLQGGPSHQQLSQCPAGSHHCRTEQVSAGSRTPTPINTHPFTQQHTLYTSPASYADSFPHSVSISFLFLTEAALN